MGLVALSAATRDRGVFFISRNRGLRAGIRNRGLRASAWRGLRHWEFKMGFQALVSFLQAKELGRCAFDVSLEMVRQVLVSSVPPPSCQP